MTRFINPWEQFTDEEGKPYADAKVFFGEPDQDPVANPKAPFSQANFAAISKLATTQTLDKKGMFETAIFLNGDYSVSLFDSAGNFIRTDPRLSGLTLASPANLTELRALTGQSDGDSIVVLGHTEAGDGGGGIWFFKLGSSGTDNDGTIVDDDAVSGQWFRIFSGEHNVQWYGAKGDGVADDTVGALAANAATLVGVTLALYWPAGVYLVDENIPADIDGSDISWRGDGFTQTEIKTKSSNVTTMLEFSSTDTNFAGFSSISQMSFNANDFADFCISGRATHLTLTHVRLRDSNVAATDISFSVSMLYDNCEVPFNNGDGLRARGSGNNNDVTFRDCKIFNNAGIGLLLGSSSSAVRVRGCAFENNADTAIFVTNAMNNLNIYGCYFEANANTGHTFTTPATTINADIIFNGSGDVIMGFGSSNKNVTVEENFVASGSGKWFIYGASIQGGSIRRNQQVGGTSRLLGGFGDSGGAALAFGSFAEVTIEGNQGFGSTFTGTHTGANNSSILTDSTQNFATNYLAGSIVQNIGDGSQGIISSNTSDDVVVLSLSGGVDNDFDNGDAYEIIVPEVSLENMPLGTPIDVGGEFGNIRYLEASKLAAFEPDFNQWNTVAGAGGTWARSAEIFPDNPNVPVWSIELLSTGTTKRQGFPIEMSDYPALKGQLGLFTLDIMHTFSGDGNGQLFVNGVTDTPATDSDNDWHKIRAFFRYTAQGIIDFSVQKVGVSGTVHVANPVISQLGAQVPQLVDRFEPQRRFFGTAQPTAGTWVQGDVVENLAATIDGNQMLIEGWYRLTSGPGNVLNTDWATMYVSTVTPAT